MKIDIKPLSINKAFQGRRFKTRDCKDFETEVLFLLKNYKKRHEGWVWINYGWHIKNFKLSDEANFIKVFQDCLVKAGIIEDDRFIKGHTSEKFQSEEEYITFKIRQCPDGDGSSHNL